MQLYNSLSKKTELLRPLAGDSVGVYSCGPTVYNHVHIGNLSSFIYADMLRRVLGAHDYKVRHVMNFTDVDDKTIERSLTEHPDLEPQQALQQTTAHYTQLFLDDLEAVGYDIEATTFIRATDETTITGMQDLIRRLVNQGFAYIADDGVYFSIDAYRRSGKTYGQLVEITASSTSESRIQNDEYDKDSAHDFALWKKQKPGEPAWEFTINGHDMTGRPGWHIECSIMSKLGLGQPFDIHTGGIDLQFPHHENEIAQSTAGQESPMYAQLFVHNEHILVDGRKMSKSLGNFYTLTDLADKHIDPLAFRLLVLQSHYRKQTNFSFDNVLAATSRLQRWRDIAGLRWQTNDTLDNDDHKDAAYDVNGIILASKHVAHEALANDLGTPQALSHIETAFDAIDSSPLSAIQQSALIDLIEWIDTVLGLRLRDNTPDISDNQKQQIIARLRARDDKDWDRSDSIRDELAQQGIILRDTPRATIWSRGEPAPSNKD